METKFLIFVFVLTDITYGLLSFQTIYNYAECDFEQQNLCGYIQQGEINKAAFNWTWHSGSTSSNATGPSSDHTTGTSTGHYIYIETSDPRKPNEAARIMSPLYVPMSEGPWCVTFWYHMYGADINTLNVYMHAFSWSGDEDLITLIWRKSFDQGDTWKTASVTVEPGGIFQLLFEGIRGEGYLGDIAIDDVSVANEACKIKDESSVDCGFDNDFCGWSQGMIDPLFHWVRTNDYEPNKGRLGGFYINTRYSKPRFFWNNYAWKDLGAYLFSPRLPKTSEKGSCFSLWYRMPEFSFGRLNIFTLSNDTPPRLHWSNSGTESNEWQQVALSIDKSTDYNIVIEGSFPKYTDLGSIAIDGIRFEDIPCVTQSG